MSYSTSRSTKNGVSTPVLAATVGAFALVGIAVTLAVSQAPTKCSPRFNSATELSCGDDEPVESAIDVSISVDVTAPRRSDVVVDAYATRALAVADPTIDHGGTLTVRSFSRSAPHGEVLFERTIPTLAEQRLAVRGEIERNARADLEAALDRALAAGTTGRHGKGSDIAGALARLGDVSRTSGAPLVGLLLTDGRVNTAELNLVAALNADPADATRRLRHAISEPTPVDALLVAGIGATGARLSVEDTALTAAITTAFEDACGAVSDHCTVTPSL